MRRAARAGMRPPRRLRTIAAAVPAMLLGAASCVPSGAAERPQMMSAMFTAPIPDVSAPADIPVPADAAPGDAQALIGDGAFAANAALPLSGLPNPAAASFVVRGLTAIDRIRAHDCLAQAVYYEAASESEDGQGAVAQVVLNRVRHPSWPNSVCGVVYQGPMRAGGGCQFTFTCDGSLARRAGGAEWLRARRIAAEALNGRVHAPVGHATHYHNHTVFPAWAPRLAKAIVIGGHIFYRMPGQQGGPSAFAAAYAGREPLPQPAMTMVRPDALAALPMPAEPHAAAPPSRQPQPVRPPSEIEQAVPQPQVQEAYRNSGQWRADSPVAPPVRGR